MKILKVGDLRRLDKPIRFECKACGCIFEADRSEYRHEFSQRENVGWYECECPTCHKWTSVNAT